MIPVRTFALSVTLFKTIARDGKNPLASRWTGSDCTIDLTPFLGDAGSVRTRKDTRAGDGRFSISFYDRIDAGGQDSLYGLIEAMDVIEIRATRHPEQYSGYDLPLIMRGYVDTVRRSEVMGDDGPQRSVIVTGRDSGKLWLIHSVFPQIAIATGQLMLTTFGLQAATGISTKIMNVSDFISAMTTQVVNPTVAALPSLSGNQIKPFATDTIATVPGSIVPSQAGSMYGSFWSIISSFSDQPWNELFIQDQEDGPHMVFREVPYKDTSGKLIMPNAVDPGTIEIDIADIIKLDVGHSDGRVANFFWVPPAQSSLDTNDQLKTLSLQDGTIYDSQYGNNDPKLYGEKKMEASTSLIPDGIGQPFMLLAVGDRPAALDQYNSWWRQRIDELKALNRDNSVFEDGEVVCCGNEDLVCGKYLRTYRGSLVSEFYISAVSQTILPLSGWTASLQVERGTGFLRRLDLPNPYVTEGMAGPYTPPLSLGDRGTAALNGLQANGATIPSGGFTANGITFGPEFKS